jgi:hypothetical protein
VIGVAIVVEVGSVIPVTVLNGNMTNKIYPVERCKLWLQELAELKEDRPSALAKLDDILRILVEEDDDEVAIRTVATILRIEGKNHRYDYDNDNLKNYRNYYERYAKIIVSMMSSQTLPPIYEIE